MRYTMWFSSRVRPAGLAKGARSGLRGLARVALAAAFAWGVAAPAAAFPDRPVRFVVPFPPGGATDALARILATDLARRWGQQVIVENRAGSQGNVGTASAARAAPDGHTLIFAHQGVLTINPHLYSAVGFDTFTNLAPVSRISVQPFVLVVNPRVPATSLAELRDLARQQPGRLTFASTSSGPQMVGELFKIASETNLTHVAYKGAAPAVTDLLGGHVDMLFASPSSVVQHVKTGRLRALAVLGATRSPSFPDTPTAAEAGFPVMGEMPDWFGVAVPAGTPAPLVERIATALADALAQPDVQAAFRSHGVEPMASTPAEFARQIRIDFDRWGKVVKAAGVKAE